MSAESDHASEEDVLRVQLAHARGLIAELRALVRAADQAFRAGPVKPVRWDQRVESILARTESGTQLAVK